jgi:hypothetical protein
MLGFAGDARPAARTRRMPLTRARDNYTLGVDGIHFLMQDGSVEVECRIALEVLSRFGRTIALSEPSEIFDNWQARNRACGQQQI